MRERIIRQPSGIGSSCPLGFLLFMFALQASPTTSFGFSKLRFGSSWILHEPRLDPPRIANTNLWARYGPRPSDFSSDEEIKAKKENILADQALKFDELLEKVIVAKDPMELPSIVSQHLDVLLRNPQELEDFINNAVKKAEESGNDDELLEVNSACDYILFFVETFCQEAKSMDDNYKSLLGKILQSISGDSSSRVREEQLDQLLTDHVDKFTPGFLRHVENECRRIATAPAMSPESAKLLETLQMIHVRIMEELGKELGQGALVLGQLVGYDNEYERLAVLEAGLTVRGNKFASELQDLTKEALDGFDRIPDGHVDSDLVARVRGIHNRVGSFLQQSRP